MNAKRAAATLLVSVSCTAPFTATPPQRLAARNVMQTAEAGSSEKQNQPATSSCPVTIGRKDSISPADFFGSGSAHWNGNLYVGGLWPDGTIVFRPGGP